MIVKVFSECLSCRKSTVQHFSDAVCGRPPNQCCFKLGQVYPMICGRCSDPMMAVGCLGLQLSRIVALSYPAPGLDSSMPA